MTAPPQTLGSLVRKLIEELREGVAARFKTRDGRELARWYVLDVCDAREFSARVSPGGYVIIDVVGCESRHRIYAVLDGSELRLRRVRSYARR
jgi:hypothetical protein